MNRIFPVIAILALGTAIAVAGCGSSSSSNEGSEYGSSGESTAATKTASGESTGRYGASGSPSSSSGAATVAVANVGGGVGKVLVDSKGFTLYYFKKDKGGKSACYGGCAKVWPPLTTGGAAHAMSGVQASMLGTTKRTDGTVEVTYAGWPLYTYEADKKPGEANGNESEGTWFVLDDETDTQSSDQPLINFHHVVGDAVVADPGAPAAAVAYPRRRLETAFASAGMAAGPLIRGTWTGGDGPTTQDIVIGRAR